MFDMREIDTHAAPPRRDTDGWFEYSAGGAVVLCPVGELDLSTASALERRLTDIVESTDAPTILVDLSRVQFIDARCVGVILQTRANACRRHRALYVEGLGGVPARVFDALGLRTALTPPTPGNDRGWRER